jgi:hypothetical protein
MVNPKTLVPTAVGAVLLLILAACGNGNGGIPSGFDELFSEREGDFTVTVYSGSGTVDEAVEGFSSWAEAGGWSATGDYGFGGYSGYLFEQGDEVMVISVIDAGAMITVSTIRGPRDADMPDDPANGNDVPDPTPTEVEGRDPALPIPPAATRSYYFEIGDDSAMVGYEVDASLDDVIEFYQRQLADWDGVNEWDGAYGEGAYTFEQVQEDPGFIITLDAQDDGTTVVSIMAGISFFE